MKTNIILLATCTALAVGSAQATQTPKPPQMAQQPIKQHHGHNEKINLKAPTAQISTNYFPQSLTKSSKYLLNNSLPTRSKANVAPQAVAATCNLDAFATSNTTALISEIKSQGTSCVNNLFSAAANIQSSTYSSANMIAVANHVVGLSQAYAGGGNNDIEAIFLFLRAGYYVEFYNKSVTFNANVTPAVKTALDAFVNNSHFYDDNDAHAQTLGEVITTMDSSGLQDVYLPVVKGWLSRWNQSYASKWYVRRAVNGIFTILFRGQYNSKFKALVATDSDLITSLNNFTQQSWMVDTDAEYLIANAARELGRMKLYSGTAIQASVDIGLKAIFSNYQIYGTGDAVWLGAADTASYYGQCSDYGICNYGEQLRTKALAQTYTCSPTLKIYSQDLTPTQQTSICTTEGAEETFFHQTVQDNTPIAGDNNTQLHINIFNSSNDYGKYAGPIFDMNTNNGGMYLEGDPSVATNIPNFVAYEASYANAPHYVWNLEHEYVHYLDGRFDLFGNFNSPTEKVVWWAEGLAEYTSLRRNNQAAIDTIHDGSTYTLSEIFETTYDGFDQDRIYRWGYLAVRFMFENHPSDVKAMIAETRVGNWTAYKARLNTWLANYSTEFTAWTQTVTSSGGTTPPANVAPIANANGPYSNDINTVINFSSVNSSDSDGNIVSYTWDFGDGTTSSVANPNHSYSSAGTYNVTLTVTDDGGLTATATASTIITDVAPPTNSNELVNNDWLRINGSQGSQTIYTLTLPAGATDLGFFINGGSGDADMYVKFGSEPTTTDYDCRPYKTGNNETCYINNEQAGTYYVMLNGYNDYDTYIMASYLGGNNSAIEDACATQSPQSNGQLQDGSAICVDGSTTSWLTIADASSHNSIAISTAHGTGDLTLDFSNSGWPNASNGDGNSANSGNNECIYLTNLNQYWGYLEISGTSAGASLVVDFDTAGCR